MDDLQPDVLTVGQLNNQIRETMLGAFPNVWVAGEISDLSRPRSGHFYFSLKDASGQINVVMWRTVAARTAFEPEDGMQVLCRGEVDVYCPRGTYQLIVRQMQIQGEGALQAALRKLREKLEAEGLFNATRKRPLPRFPRRIAVVTSPSGAALNDFLEVVRRRWNDIQITVVPTRVQGIDSAREVATAIHRATQIPHLDAILVTRGGGSLEDLWAFNDEAVVRAIHASPVPVVSAIGHEIDVTLSDLVADVRALTPSEAGERLVPDSQEMRSRVDQCRTRMTAVMRSRVATMRSQLAGLAERRVVREPHSLLREHERQLDELHQRSTRAIRQSVERSQSQLATIAGRLETLSPLQVLSRGYSLTQKIDGKIVRSSRDVSIAEELQIRLADGCFVAQVKTIDTSRPQDEE